MLSCLQRLFSKERVARPSVLAITPFYMDQLALRIASSRKNWDLLICPTFRSGLRTLRKFPVSVILFDLETRDVEWRRGVQLLLSQSNDSCLIVLTRNLDDDLWQSAFERGVYDLQPKPLKDNLRLIESVGAAHALIASHELTHP
jgi:DNA-binding NtrC family response regulator